jgi:hypothetical protein
LSLSAALFYVGYFWDRIYFFGDGFKLWSSWSLFPE